MKKRILLLCLFTSFILAANIYSQTDSLSDIFPLKVGNSWEYRFHLVHGLPDIQISNSDTGVVRYFIYRHVIYNDSIVWKFKQNRKFKREHSVHSSTTISNITDSSFFDIVEVLNGRHELYTSQEDFLSTFPFFQTAPDSEKFYRYVKTDTCGYALLNLFPKPQSWYQYSATYHVYKDIGLTYAKGYHRSSYAAMTAYYIIPSIFGNLQPKNNSMLMPPIDFSWTNSIGVTPYIFQIARDSTFNNIVVDSTTQVPTINITLDLFDFSTDYFWRVKTRGIIGCDEYECQSQVFYFRTSHPEFEKNSELIYPKNDLTEQPTNIEFKWSQIKLAQSYSLQISADSTFLYSSLNYTGLVDTIIYINSLSYDKQYYWKIKTISASGAEYFSPIWKFKTRKGPWDTNALLIYPPNNSTEKETSLEFKWSKVPLAWSYGIQLTSDSSFTKIEISFDGLTDTTRTIDTLRNDCEYFWRVKTINLLRKELWSPIWKFKTITLPTEYYLSQNYPNPFNPSTVIKYQVPSLQAVSLKVYDILGREVATLVNEEKPAGNYEVIFNGEGLPSGVYFYSLHAGNFHQTKKMLLLK
ncbi:MAG: T9SS type A sorting domain-containing protein [bacterium]